MRALHFFRVRTEPSFVQYIKKGPGPPIALNHNRISPHGRSRRQICLDVSPRRSDDCDDRNPVKEKLHVRKRNR